MNCECTDWCQLCQDLLTNRFYWILWKYFGFRCWDYGYLAQLRQHWKFAFRSTNGSNALNAIQQIKANLVTSKKQLLSLPSGIVVHTIKCWLKVWSFCPSVPQMNKPNPFLPLFKAERGTERPSLHKPAVNCIWVTLPKIAYIWMESIYAKFHSSSLKNDGALNNLLNDGRDFSIAEIITVVWMDLLTNSKLSVEVKVKSWRRCFQ